MYDEAVNDSLAALKLISEWFDLILFNLTNQQPDIDKIYLYTKDPYKAKQQFLLNKRESTVLMHFNVSKALIEYSNEMDHNYKNIEEQKPNKKRKILIVFDYMIADMLMNKKFNPKVTELFVRGRKLNSCFYCTILLFCLKKYQTKFYTLFYYENSKQIRTSTNCI